MNYFLSYLNIFGFPCTPLPIPTAILYHLNLDLNPTQPTSQHGRGQIWCITMCWSKSTNREWMAWAFRAGSFAWNPLIFQKTRTMTVYGQPIVTDWVPSLVRAAAPTSLIRTKKKHHHLPSFCLLLSFHSNRLWPCFLFSCFLFIICYFVCSPGYLWLFQFEWSVFVFVF